MSDSPLADDRLANPLKPGFSHMVTAICWFGLFSEGYDMGVLGAVLPGLLADRSWDLGPMAVGMLASSAMLGMFFGGYSFGVLSDRYGRKACFLICLTLFSMASGLAAVAPTPILFGAFRFIAGLGIGGIIPVAAALTCEFAPADKVNREFALMYSGYSLGILAASLASFFLLETLGWRTVVGLGAAPLLLVPIIARFLPESPAFLLRNGQRERAARVAARWNIELGSSTSMDVPHPKIEPGLRALFTKNNRMATIGFWFATFAGMVLVYGLNTWLPQIMRASGYDLGPSILFLGTFALASAGGGVILGLLADRFGRARTIRFAFLFGSTMIMLLVPHWPLPITYLLVAGAGIGTVSAAVMVTSYLSQYFPPELRGTAVGSCLSFSRAGAVCGPVLGGLVAAYHLAPTWNFAIFAAAGILAMVSISLVPNRSWDASSEHPAKD